MSAAESTHPFLTFDFDTRHLSATAWLIMGEAMSKCEHLAGVPLKPRAARELMSVYLQRGIQATTAIEGNTLSDEEIKKIVEKGTADVGESRQYQEREVQNVLAAVRQIDAQLAAGELLPITVQRLCDLNRQILAGIPDSEEVVPGQERRHNVTAGRYRAPDWAEVPELNRRLTKWLEELRGGSGPKRRREDRFVQSLLAAVLAHLYLAWIHGFGNGNGRLARLIEVQILSESGVVPIVATNLLSNFYNKTRSEYYRHLDLAQREPHRFVEYALAGFRDELRDQIAEVRRESLQIHWESYVYEVFRSELDGAVSARRRELALVMPWETTVTKDAATELTNSLAKKYAACGDRTIARDLNVLIQLGLVERSGRRYRAKREEIEAFLPVVSVSE